MTKPDTTVNEYLTRAEVAGLLRCSVDSIDRRIAEGVLPAFKSGGRVLIRRHDVGAMLAARVKKATGR